MTFSSVPVWAATLLVGTGQTYQTIQGAVDAAQDSDIIIVKDGTYTENVEVYKSVTIQSENGNLSAFVGFLDSWDHIFNVSAPNVTIDGFSIFGATDGQNAGINLDSAASGCKIKNNRCGWDASHKNVNGIFLNYSTGNTIESNICIANDWDGIHLGLRNSNDNRLIDNTVTQSLGINIESSSGNTITGNNCHDNDYTDLYLVFSDNNKVYLNRFRRTDESPVDSGVSTNLWVTGYPVLFDHQQHGLQIALAGNFYGDHDLTDLDNNGIADSAYDLPGTEPDDSFPLSQNAAFYTAAVTLEQELITPADTTWGVYRSLEIIENGELMLEGQLIIGFKG